MSKLSDEIIHTLSYFDHFAYPPTFDELKRYLRVRASTQEIKDALRIVERKGNLFTYRKRFALKEHVLKDYIVTRDYSIKLLQSFERVLPWYSWIPTIRLLGISGSLSMHDVQEDGDIDLFLVAQKETLWMTRFMVLLITRVVSFFRISPTDKLCWNLMIEEWAVILPTQKRNEYTAHEVLQMKPVLDRGSMHQMFLCANSWVSVIFPNVQLKCTEKKLNYRLSQSHSALKIVDNFFRFFQMRWLERKGVQITEYRGQAWFIQDDTEKNIPVTLKNIS